MELSERALKLHREAIVVDAHCDTVHLLCDSANRYHFKQLNSVGHLDLPRLRQGGVDVQLFALCVAPLWTGCEALRRAKALLAGFHRMVGDSRDELSLVLDMAGLNKCLADGKLAVLLTVEGGEPLEGRLEVLHDLYAQGVRGFALTWNDRNLLADGVGAGRPARGLSEFGRRVLREANNLGMLIDAAHLAEKAYYELLDASATPVIVSHANAATVSKHRRNLKDAQLRALRDQGGVVGLTFYPPFVTGRKDAGIDDLLKHFCYIAEHFGVEILGLGSDYDGITRTINGLEDVSRLPVLTESLLKHGFTEEEVKMILGGNFMRAISSSLG